KLNRFAKEEFATLYFGRASLDKAPVIEDLDGLCQWALEGLGQSGDPSSESTQRALSGIREDFQILTHPELKVSDERFEIAFLRSLAIVHAYLNNGNRVSDSGSRVSPGTRVELEEMYRSSFQEEIKQAIGKVEPRSDNELWHAPEEVQYTPSSQNEMEQLETQLRRQPARLGSLDEILNHRPAENLVDQVWFYQAQDLAKQIKGSSVRIVDVKSLLEPFPGDDSQDAGPPPLNPHYLDQALTLLKESGASEVAQQVMEIRLPNSYLRLGKRIEEKEDINGEVVDLLQKTE